MPPNFSRNLILVKISDNRYLIRRGNRSPWPWHYIKTLNDVTSENHMFHFPPNILNMNETRPVRIVFIKKITFHLHAEIHFSRISRTNPIPRIKFKNTRGVTN